MRRDGLLFALAQQPPAQALGSHTHRISQQLDQLRPIFEWKWGAIFATVLAMVGSILAIVPVALVYRRTKGPREYDPGVMHSSIILAPTIAGVLMVIQGSLAMAFSLAGVVTAVRFRNSLKDTNDAVYVFVAVAIGLAAGGQALDIAVAISLVFCVTALLLSKSPLRASADWPPGGGSSHEHHHHHHHHHHYDRAVTTPEPSRVESLVIRTADPGRARPIIEAILERQTKEWRLDRSTPGANGEMTLLYLIYRRKGAPRDGLMKDLESLTRSGGVTVDVVPGIQPDPAQN